MHTQDFFSWEHFIKFMCRARWASEDPNFQNSLRWTNFRAPCLIFVPGNPAYKWFSKAGKVFHGFDWIAAQGTLRRGKTASQRMEEGKAKAEGNSRRRYKGTPFSLSCPPHFPNSHYPYLNSHYPNSRPSQIQTDFQMALSTSVYCLPNGLKTWKPLLF